MELDHIDFVKVYCGQMYYCGWLGETSTEVAGAEDLHPDAVAVIMGDVNGDQVVDIGDVTDLISHVLGNPVTPFNVDVANVNGDDGIDIGDVTELINKVLGNN